MSEEQTQPAPASDRIEYRADLDGLRGIAVIGVILFHANLGLAGGYAGVDVFFVISGFLITSLILSQRAGGTFTFFGFYERRARRLAPALFLLIGCALAASWWLLLPHELRETAQATVASSVGLANVYFAREAGYFTGTLSIMPLLHVWSLAVEIQFYLLAPALLIVLLRWGKGATLLVVAGLAVASLLWSGWYTAKSPSKHFYSFTMRAWELLLGVVIALAWPEKSRSLNRVFSELFTFVGLGLIGYSFVAFGPRSYFPGWSALYPCLGAALVVIAKPDPDTFGGRLLCWRPLVFVGTISYSLYLWHWPPIAFANYFAGAGITVSIAGILVIGIVGALISWAAVEMPFRRRRFVPGRLAMVAGTAVIGVAFAGAGYAIHANEGVPGRYEERTATYAAGRTDWNPTRLDSHYRSAEQIESGDLPRLGDPMDQRPAKVLMLGDSHADSMMPLMHDLAREFDVPGIGISRTRAVPLVTQTNRMSRNDRIRRAVFARIMNSAEMREVVLVARWDHYPQALTPDALAKTVEHIRDAGCRAWIMRQAPLQQFNVPRRLALGELLGIAGSRWGIDRQTYLARRKNLDEVFAAAEKAGAIIIDPADVMFDGDGRGYLERGGRSLYWDQDHLSTYGARQFREQFTRMFASDE